MKNSIRSLPHPYERVGGKPPKQLYVEDIQTDMEAQNDDLINDLHEKVQGLKELAYGIRYQVEESHTLLDEMGIAMTTAGNLLRKSLLQVNQLSRFKTKGHLCTMMLFFFGILFLMYIMFRPARY